MACHDWRVDQALQDTASSIMISTFERSIVDVPIAPLSSLEVAPGDTLGGVARGAIVSAAITLVSDPIAGVRVEHPHFCLGGTAISFRALQAPWGFVTPPGPLVRLTVGLRSILPGRSDIPPTISPGVALAATAPIFARCVPLLGSGYRLRK